VTSSPSTPYRHSGPKPRHGHAKDGQVTPTWRSWMSMRLRCKSAEGKHRAYYGARGITVCERWRVFEHFLADMGERPAGTTLDRIDGSKGYEPGNCRWATSKTQGSNRACVDQIAYKGKTQNPEDWARELGLKPQTIRSRIARGWPLERVMTAQAKRGTPGESGRHKITTEIALKIRAEFRFYSPHRTNAKELAAKYGVSDGIAYMVGTGRSWSHLGESE
jgi:hypothetical protein